MLNKNRNKERVSLMQQETLNLFLNNCNKFAASIFRFNET